MFKDALCKEVVICGRKFLFCSNKFFSHIWTAWTTCEKSGTNECEIFLGMLATLMLNHTNKFNKNTGYEQIRV